jgi:hypothetical protein
MPACSFAPTPPAYRSDRGEEIIGTLLEVSPPGSTWPVAREAASVIAAGVRARAATNRRQPAVTNLRLVLLLAAVLWLSWDCYELMTILVSPRGQTFSILAGLLIATTVAAPWFAPRVVAVLLAAGTAVAAGLAYHNVAQSPRLIYLAPQVIPSLTLAIVTAAGASRPPRAWFWLTGALGAASILRYAQDMAFSPLVNSGIGLAIALITWGVVAAAVLWLAVDVRPALALLIGWEWLLAPTAAFAALRGDWLFGPYYMNMAVPLAGVAIVLAIRRLGRKQERSSPERGGRH